jgi:hypothetical protein
MTTKWKSKPKKWIGKAIQRPGALRAKAAKAGGLTKSGKISKTWARSKRAKLRAKPKRTKAETRTLRQLNLFLTLRK